MTIEHNQSLTLTPALVYIKKRKILNYSSKNPKKINVKPK